jgi:hypothetical protein
MARPVINLSKDIIYPSVREAALYYGISTCWMTTQLRNGVRNFFGDICVYKHDIDAVDLDNYKED